MANNKMTPEQDIVTREFYKIVAMDEDLMTVTGLTGRQVRGICLQLLNYAVVKGSFVDPAKIKGRPYSGSLTMECEWTADTRRAMEALVDEDNSSGEDEADSSEPPTDTEIREAVLREDV